MFTNKKTIYFIALLSISILFVGVFILNAQTNLKQTNSVTTTNNNTNSIQTNMAVKTQVQGKKANKASFIERYFDMGGPFMYPLILLSIIGLGIVMERFWFFSRRKLNMAGFAREVVTVFKDKGVEAAKKHCSKVNSNISCILESGLMMHDEGEERVEKTIATNGSIEISHLERGLSILAAVANLAPLLGFLGTVTGMISAFQAIASADTVSAKLVSVGIFEALVTTAVGLIVAIPAFAFHNIFVHKIDKFATEVEQGSSSIVTAMIMNKRKDKGTEQ